MCLLLAFVAGHNYFYLIMITVEPFVNSSVLGLNSSVRLGEASTDGRLKIKYLHVAGVMTSPVTVSVGLREVSGCRGLTVLF